MILVPFISLSGEEEVVASSVLEGLDAMDAVCIVRILAPSRLLAPTAQPGGRVSMVLRSVEEIMVCVWMDGMV